MPLAIWVLLGMGLAAAAIFLATQVVGPANLRKKFTEEMARRGWAAVTFEADEAWAEFAELAARGTVGADAQFAYEVGREFGREKGTIRKKQKAVPAAAFRDPGGRHPRFAAAGSRTQTETHRFQAAGLHAPAELSWSKAHELWVGEVRPLPVDAPAIASSSLHEISGGMAALKANPAAVGLPPLLDGDLAERVRALLRDRQAVLRFGPTVHVGPTGWVLVTMIQKSMPRLGELLELAGEIAQVFDWVPARGSTA